MGTLLDEIVAEEGCVDHLYLDTRGNATCGVGRLIAKQGDLGLYTWSDFVTALKDFRVLQEMKRNSSYGLKWPASRFKPLMRARMFNPREGLQESIIQIDKSLGKRLPWFDAAPVAVCEALTDMSYNLGIDGLVKGYPKMLAALAAKDYPTAAAESGRKGISDARNARTHDRIQSATARAARRP